MQKRLLGVRCLHRSIERGGQLFSSASRHLAAPADCEINTTTESLGWKKRGESIVGCSQLSWVRSFSTWTQYTTKEKQYKRNDCDGEPGMSWRWGAQLPPAACHSVFWCPFAEDFAASESLELCESWSLSKPAKQRNVHANGNFHLISDRCVCV